MDDKKRKILSKCKSIGKTSRVKGRVDKNNPHFVSIGEYVMVGGDSVIITHGPIRPYYEDPSINIEDLVWIGSHCLILPGVTIGRNSIIGAGSVLSKSTEPYSIYAGNPAKFIRYRKDGEILRSFTVRWLMRKVMGCVSKEKIKWSLLKKDHISFIFPDGRYDGMDLSTILERNLEEVK